MEPQQPTKPISRKRRWFRFSLRTLLVLIALCAVLSAIGAAYLAPYHRERQLIADLQRRYEQYVFFRHETHGPWWLKRFAKGKYAERVRMVEVGCELSAEDLASFRRFRHLDDVTFCNVLWISDACAEQLGMLSGLQTLWLLDTGISNEGLAHLRGLGNLTDLHIHTPMVTDDGLKHIGELTGLESLVLVCNTTDDGLKHIRSLRNLRRLELHCSSTDDGLKHIGSLTNLRELVLQCRVTDAGMVHLAGLKNLVKLDCRGYPQRERTRYALEDDTRLEFIEVPLEDVCQFLSDQHALLVRLDPEAIQAGGIKPDVPVTAKHKGIELHTALDNVLDPLGLVWMCDSQGITVTTKEIAASRRPGLTTLKRNLKKLKEVSTDW
jgi:hypothetical protein